MNSTWLQSLLQDSHWPALIVFLLLWLESFPFTGVLLPGVALVTGLGALVTTQAMNYVEILLIGSLGAFLGEHLIRKKLSSDQLQRYQALHEKIRHMGLESVLAGRFLWFVHPLVPLMLGAGMLPFCWFVAISLPTCLLWMNTYLLLGVLLAGVFSENSPAALEAISVFAVCAVILLLILLAYRQTQGRPLS